MLAFRKDAPWLTISAVTNNDAAPVYPIGAIFEEPSTGKQWVYVKFNNGSGNIAAAVGGVAYAYAPATTGIGTVTSDWSDTYSNFPVGIFMAVLTDLYHGFVQTKGYYATVLTNGDDDIAAGDSIISGAADLVVNSTAAGTAATQQVIGIAATDDVNADNTVAVYLTLGL